MSKNNIISVVGFLKDYFLWQTLFLLFHKKLLFKFVDGKSAHFSVSLLCYLIVLYAFVSFFIVLKNNRKSVSVFVSALLPLEIYTVISYYPYFKIKTTITIIILAILLTAYGVMLFARKIKNKTKYWEIVFKRISKYVYCSRIICVLALLVIVLPITVKAWKGQPLYQAKTEPVGATEENTYTIANNIETVCMLQENIWKELTIDEKMEVLQVIANIEANSLGISTELRVTADNLDILTLGEYKDVDHQITIDIERLNNATAHNVLEILCHEAYHGYENRLTDLYLKLNDEEKRLKIFSDVEQYAREFADYKSGEGYYSQAIEKDSREYSKEAVEYYYECIEKHLNKLKK